MNILKYESKLEMSQAAARTGAEEIRNAISARGGANIIVATGASQLQMLEALVVEPDIAWDRVTVFHLDEYVGISVTHPASFRRYLWERFHSKLPAPLKAFHYIDGEADPEEECRRVSDLIAGVSIDVCFCGIGENAHLAFNDPPADFKTECPYILVKLDEACRNQQVAEGWFPALDAVPEMAVSMSIQQMIKSKKVICTVPGERKADAVQKMLESELSPLVPASILREHADAELYLDADAAAKIQ